MNTLITHVHIFTPECTLTRMLPSLNIKPQVFSWKNTLAPLKPAAQIIFSPSECGLSAINLYLTAAQLCERDFSAVGTFLALSIFAEKRLFIYSADGFNQEIESHYRFYPLRRLDGVQCLASLETSNVNLSSDKSALFQKQHGKTCTPLLASVNTRMTEWIKGRMLIKKQCQTVAEQTSEWLR